MERNAELAGTDDLMELCRNQVRQRIGLITKPYLFLVGTVVAFNGVQSLSQGQPLLGWYFVTLGIALNGWALIARVRHLPALRRELEELSSDDDRGTA